MNYKLIMNHKKQCVMELIMEPACQLVLITSSLTVRITMGHYLLSASWANGEYVITDLPGNAWDLPGD